MKSKLVINGLIFFAILLATACSNNTSQEDKGSANSVVKSFPPGKVVDQINCNQNPAYNYALYLPSYFNPAKLYPVIVVFDAHARGKMAVCRFKEASEKFGYIIIGSNNSKNGSKKIDNIVSTLFVDVFALPGVDKNRIYTAGFSGGCQSSGINCHIQRWNKGCYFLRGWYAKRWSGIEKQIQFYKYCGLE